MKTKKLRLEDIKVLRSTRDNLRAAGVEEKLLREIFVELHDWEPVFFNNSPVRVVRRNANGTSVIEVDLPIDGEMATQTLQRTVRSKALQATKSANSENRRPA